MLKLSTLAMLVAGALVATGCGPTNRNKKRAKYGGGGSGADFTNAPPPGGGPAATGGKYTLMPTSAATALLRITTDPVNEERPALSPDGSTLLVGLRVFDNAAKLSRYPGIVAVDPNGGPGRTLLTQSGTEADRAAWVPDGSTFVYATNAPGGAWTLVRANSRMPGAGFSVIISANVAPLADFPTVAPDGLIAFTVDVQKVTMIATVRMDGTGYQLVQQGTFASFSPDGKRMAFSRNVGDATHLFVSDRSGGAIMQLTFGKASAVAPAWSPDGQFIAFASTKDTEHLPLSQQHHKLYVIRSTGGGITKLTEGTADCNYPNWGVDGNIYFNSDQAGNYDIWRIRPVLTAVGSSI